MPCNAVVRLADRCSSHKTAIKPKLPKAHDSGDYHFFDSSLDLVQEFNESTGEIKLHEIEHKT